MSNVQPPPATPSQPILLSQADTARLLAVERTTIYRLLRAGELTKVKVGRRALVTRASVDEFVARQIDAAGER